MTTALDIITGAARLTGIIFKSEVLSADEASDGLVSLNDMIESWSNNGLMIVARVRDVFTVPAGNTFTIGPGQTLNTIRPLVIRSAYVSIANTDYELIPITDEQWESISQKDTASTWPTYINYNNGYPTGQIRLWPALSSAAQLNLLSEKPLSSFPDLTSDVDLPPGGKRMLRYNLAIEISPEYGVEVPSSVAVVALNSLNAYQLSIAKNRPIKYSGQRILPNRRALFNGGYYL